MTAIVENVTEYRKCNSCGNSRPIEEFRVNRRDGEISWRRRTCIPCHARLCARKKIKSRWRTRWNERSQEIPQRAIYRFLEENPYAMQEFFKLFPNQIASYMKAEKMVVFNEILEESKKYGSSRRKYPDISAKVAEELRIEFFT